MGYLSDKTRTEIMLAPRFMLEFCLLAIKPDDTPDSLAKLRRAIDLFGQSEFKAVEDLPAAKQASLLKRSDRLRREIWAKTMPNRDFDSAMFLMAVTRFCNFLAQKGVMAVLDGSEYDLAWELVKDAGEASGEEFERDLQDEQLTRQAYAMAWEWVKALQAAGYLRGLEAA